MLFNPSKVAFGRHETFALRYSLLTKGFQSVVRNSEIFTSEDATVELGVGKNMVNAIRYWLLAARLIEQSDKGFKPTPLGTKIFGKRSGFDPYMEDEATIWLVHWLIASNPELATAWYWFFNKFHKPEFTSQEAANSLLDFSKQSITAKVSATTIRNDSSIVLRMYARSRGNTRTPIEEALDSPLSLLGLVTQAAGGRTYFSKAGEREGLPLGVFGFAITEVFRYRSATEMPIEELMYAKGDFPAPGAVFRLTENSLITKLEKLIHFR